MTDTQDQGLFDTPAEDLNAPVQFEDGVSYKDQLVGEGKKYRDEEALARSRVEADRFIERLKQETAMLRGELQKRDTVEDLMKKLTSTQASKNTEKEPDAPDLGSQHNDTLTPDRVKNLLQEEIAAQREQERREQNAKLVREELVRRFGPHWQSALRSRQQELEMSDDTLTNLAQTQPKAFLTLVGDAPKTVEGFTPPESSITPRRQASPAGTKTWSYYQKLQRENFREFMSPKIQNEMNDQALKLGAAFYDK